MKNEKWKLSFQTLPISLSKQTQIALSLSDHQNPLKTTQNFA